MFTLSIAWWAASHGGAAPAESVTVPPPDSGDPMAWGDDELIIREVFRSHLPKTLRVHALRLGLHPHIGDYSNKDHLRISTRLRYALTEKWEISAGGDLYFSHGHGNVPSFDRYGVSSVECGTKINLGQAVFAGWELAAGFDYESPIGHPPAEMTDGLRHFIPYVTFSHRLESHRGLRVFWGLRLDAVQRTSIPGTFKRNNFQDSSTGITGGFVIDRRNLHYTFETSFDTTRLVSDADDDLFRIRPGVIWEILSRRHPGTRSNWVVGAAVSTTFGPDGTHFGASLKLRYNRNIKNRFRSAPRVPAP